MAVVLPTQGTAVGVFTAMGSAQVHQQSVQRQAGASLVLRDVRRWRPAAVVDPHVVAFLGHFGPRALDLFNLLNRQGSDIDCDDASRLKGKPAGGFNDIHFHPMESRSVRLSMTTNF